MFALQGTASAVSSGTMIGAVLAAIVLAIFWRTILKILLAIAAVSIIILVLSGAELLLRYAHHLPK